ncbi:alpha/beta hydrolase [Blastococcus saxobsidens]|uniref:Alpha/beta hydrolase family protein n=1 Tax=Blastococcus saxobsidens (strain DD2) TaxID=1146883 RepID=H6RR50_BLASD|nr:alpha/beta hydrolase [Blastococcus saxobsidens]CCG04130.1 Alpha/beta hydrolase family protein [Blastococcus saxobsidens DD2]
MRLHRGLSAAASGLLLALPLALAGCTSEEPAAEPTAASSTPTEPEVAPIEWTDCDPQIQPLIGGQPGSERDIAFECGRTEVPISYEEPAGATLPLFLVRAKLAGQTDRIGSLMVNPGGPGGSGADAAIGLALTLPEDVLRRFDIVGFDPRGVGLSTPVECIPKELKDRAIAAEPRPTTQEQLDDVFAISSEVAEGCAEEYGEALGTFNTVDTARDMEQLRQSLGEEQLNFLGYSYGTTLGSTYAELYPDRVRAMVLDAAVDPDTDLIADAEASAAGFEAGFDAFAANCTSLIAGCPLGPDPRLFLDELLTQAQATPIPSSEPGETRQATPGVILTAVQAGLYDTASWPQLAQGLAAARAGDATALLSLADDYSGRLEDGTYSNLLDANLAINCADTDQTVEEERVRELVAEWSATYPLFGAGSAAGLFTCSVWDAERTPVPERDAEGSAPILVIGNQGDPVTPLPGAVDLAEDLDNGVLLTWQGQGHTAYPKTECVTAAVNAYLIDLTVPMDGLTCPA